MKYDSERNHNNNDKNSVYKNNVNKNNMTCLYYEK